MPQSARGALGRYTRFDNGEPGTIAQGDACAIDKDNANTVIRADPSSVLKMPAIGFAAVVRPGEVFVQTDGDISLPSLVIEGGVILPNRPYYLQPGSPGHITASVPTEADFGPGGGFVQQVAIGRASPDPTRVQIFIARTIFGPALP
jgi:hypothetical protein